MTPAGAAKSNMIYCFFALFFFLLQQTDVFVLHNADCFDNSHVLEVQLPSYIMLHGVCQTRAAKIPVAHLMEIPVNALKRSHFSPRHCL